MASLDQLSAVRLTPAKRIWLGALRLYLVVASAMVVVRVAQITFGYG